MAQPLYVTNPNEWLVGLQRFVYSKIVPMTGLSKEQGLRLIDNSAMKIWVKAFTHISFKRNPGQNYETIEHLGDRVLNLTFTVFLSERFPNITDQEVSNLLGRYLSKSFQSQIGNYLGLQNWVRSNVDINIHVKEDLMEAMFGALFEIGEQAFLPGSGFDQPIMVNKLPKYPSGYAICYNVTEQLFKDQIIDLRFGFSQPKSMVKEIFEKVKWRETRDIFQEIEQVSKRPNGTVVYTLVFPRLALEYLRSIGVLGPNDTILAQGEGRTNKEAQDQAYQNATEHLQRLGITWEWATEVGNQYELESPDLGPFYKEATKKAEQNGYKRIYFSKPIDSKGQVFIQLLGEKQPNPAEPPTIDILDTFSYEAFEERRGHQKERNIKKDVLIKYANA